MLGCRAVAIGVFLTVCSASLCHSNPDDMNRHVNLHCLHYLTGTSTSKGMLCVCGRQLFITFAAIQMSRPEMGTPACMHARKCASENSLPKLDPVPVLQYEDDTGD